MGIDPVTLVQKIIDWYLALPDVERIPMAITWAADLFGIFVLAFIKLGDAIATRW